MGLREKTNQYHSMIRKKDLSGWSFAEARVEKKAGTMKAFRGAFLALLFLWLSSGLLWGKNTPGQFEFLLSYQMEINSMCSQSCEKFWLGTLRLPEPLKIKGEQGVTELRPLNGDKVFTGQGKLVTFSELPTVAGPNPKVENPSEERTIVGASVSQFRYFEFIRQTSTATGKKFQAAGKKGASALRVQLNNPFSRSLSLRVEYGYGEDARSVPVSLPARGRKFVDLPVAGITGESLSVTIHNFGKGRSEQPRPSDTKYMFTKPVVFVQSRLEVK